jgi:hypothetical protein
MITNNDVAKTAGRTRAGATTVEEPVTTPVQISPTITNDSETVGEDEERPKKRIKIIFKNLPTRAQVHAAVVRRRNEAVLEELREDLIIDADLSHDAPIEDGGNQDGSAQAAPGNIEIPIFESASDPPIAEAAEEPASELITVPTPAFMKNRAATCPDESTDSNEHPDDDLRPSAGRATTAVIDFAYPTPADLLAATDIMDFAYPRPAGNLRFIVTGRRSGRYLGQWRQ